MTTHQQYMAYLFNALDAHTKEIATRTMPVTGKVASDGVWYKQVRLFWGNYQSIRRVITTA